jgi:hypothetical protein
MNNESMRDRNILDEGVKHHERVLVKGIGGKIVGVDFNAQMIQIEVNVPAYMVKRDDRVIKEDVDKAKAAEADEIPLFEGTKEQLTSLGSM